MKKTAFLTAIFFLAFIPAGSSATQKQQSTGGIIYLMPCGSVSPEFLLKLKKIAETPFGIAVNITAGFNNAEFSYNAKRRQYQAPVLLSKIRTLMPADALRVAGITDKDIYDHGLNFIFGEAQGSVCIVSLNRFMPCTELDSPAEEKLLLERMGKTLIHELGHTFRLRHCSDPECVMFFSNWIGDTDRKSDKFCKKHKKSLDSALKAQREYR
jgi:archaemetzincin